MFYFGPTWGIKHEERMEKLLLGAIPLSQKCGEKQQGSAVNVGPRLPFLKSFQY